MAGSWATNNIRYIPQQTTQGSTDYAQIVTSEQLTDSLLGGLANGTMFTALTAVPSSPTAGMIVMADRVTWDPLSKGTGGAYLTMYLGSSSGWGEITDQCD